jgi:hypothetical protein
MRRLSLAGVILLATTSLAGAHGSNYKKSDFIRLIEERDAKIEGYKNVVEVLTNGTGYTSQYDSLREILDANYANWDLVLKPALDSESLSQDLTNRIEAFDDVINMLRVEREAADVSLAALEAIPEPDVYDSDVHDIREEFRPLIEQRELIINGPGGYKELVASLTRDDSIGAAGLLVQAEAYVDFWDFELEGYANVEVSPATHNLILLFDNCACTPYQVDFVDIQAFLVREAVTAFEAIPEPEEYDEHRAY